MGSLMNPLPKREPREGFSGRYMAVHSIVSSCHPGALQKVRIILFKTLKLLHWTFAV